MTTVSWKVENGPLGRTRLPMVCPECLPATHPAVGMLESGNEAHGADANGLLWPFAMLSRGVSLAGQWAQSLLSLLTKSRGVWSWAFRASCKHKTRYTEGAKGLGSVKYTIPSPFYLS